MSAPEKAKSVGGAISGIVGTLGGAATIATWLNVTPEMVGAHAYAVLYAALPIASFAFGAVAGWGLKWFLDSRRQPTIRFIAPTASDEDIRRDVMSLGPEVKALMLVVADGNEVYARTDDCRYGLHRDERFVSQFLSMEKIDGGLTLISPTSRLKPFVDGNRDLFSRVGDTAAIRKMPPSEKGTHHYGAGSDDGCPFWWWFDETEASRAD